MNICYFILDSVLYFEIGAAILSIISYKKYSKPRMIWLPIFLVTVVCVEFTGLVMSKFDLPNVLLYNLLSAMEIAVFSFIFYPLIEIKWQKKIVLMLLAICLISLLANLILIKDPCSYFLMYGFGLASIYISSLACFYLYNLAQTPKVLHLFSNMFVWICFGLLCYHLCSLPITVLANILDPIDMNDQLLVVMAIPSIIMYCCFINGFLWVKKKYSF